MEENYKYNIITLNITRPKHHIMQILTTDKWKTTARGALTQIMGVL